MGMELAQHVTDGTRGFLELGAGLEAQLGHRIDDAALYRFQTIADMRQCAIEHHIHRIIEIGAFCKRLER